MNKSFFSKQTVQIIIKDKTLRVALTLIASFLLLSVGMFAISVSYAGKIELNYTQIENARLKLQELQSIVTEGRGGMEASVATGRDFASYDEIVPFISLLESLFAIIDKNSKIIIQDKENQIYANRYADYEVTLKPKNKLDLFYKALDELHTSKFITKIVEFNMNYIPDADSGLNVLDEVNLTIRLYFE